MTTWLITRHPGAIEWMQRRGIAYDRHERHLDAACVQAGDLVIGTLPVPLAAQVCDRGARYAHLNLDLPEILRGVELTADQLDACGARLEDFLVMSGS